MDLSGSWRATPATEDVRRTFQEPDLDDRTWVATEIPGHWSATPGLADEHSVLHRRRFDHPGVAVDRRLWLRFDGIAQQGDVWLDGSYVGDTEGYFVPHTFDVTDLCREPGEHVLAVDVDCRAFGALDGRSTLTGALQDPELSGAAGQNPGGIWRPVTLVETGTTAIRFFRVRCVDANPTRARLAVRCVLDHPGGGEVVLRTAVAGTDHELVHPAAAGENRVEWTIEVPDPDLWWPHSLGDQPLHELTCDVLVDGAVHDRRVRRVGFRSVRMRNWVLSINGTRLYTKGVGMLPTTPRPGDASAAEVAGDIGAARDAGLDLVRLIAHIARPEVYDRADELGVLLWQDMPIRGLMARGVRAQATRQAREAVDLLAHHPSVAVWCAHDEPFKRPDPPMPTPPLLGQQRPTWNRAVLDRSVKRVIERTDGSRPVVAHTAVAPHLPQLDGTTSHLWFGWVGGRASDLAGMLARTPRMGRYVSAFGAATADPDLDILTDPRWPAIDWAELGERLGASPAGLRHLVPPGRVGDGRTWAELTRVAQAEVVRTTIELLRRLKYRPNGGFAQHYLADPSPAGGFGLLDSDRRPKPSWQALVDACRPVIVVADPLPPLVRPGESVGVRVHVVSDRREELGDAVVRARFSATDGEVATRRWGGAIPADDCAFIGTIDCRVPQADGELTLDLELTAGDLAVTNRYVAVIR